MNGIMDEMSIGIIYTIKHNATNYRIMIVHFLSNYTLTPPEHYTKAVINRILKNVFYDAVQHNEHPQSLVRDYFESKESREEDRIASALSLMQVKEKNKESGEYEYINGFKEFDEMKYLYSGEMV